MQEKKYIMVTWPEIKEYMNNKNWRKCIPCKPLKGHDCPDGAWMIPEEIYNSK